MCLCILYEFKPNTFKTSSVFSWAKSLTWKVAIRRQRAVIYSLVTLRSTYRCIRHRWAQFNGEQSNPSICVPQRLCRNRIWNTNHIRDYIEEGIVVCLADCCNIFPEDAQQFITNLAFFCFRGEELSKSLSPKPCFVFGNWKEKKNLVSRNMSFCSHTEETDLSSSCVDGCSLKNQGRLTKKHHLRVMVETWTTATRAASSHVRLGLY